jgi:hypothetical protein
MVKEIDRWAPEYVSLGSQFDPANRFTWAKARMSGVISSRLRSPDRNGAVAFWIISAFDGDVGAKDRWTLPDCLIQRSSMQRVHLLPADEARQLLSKLTSDLIREEHQAILGRLEHALAQAVDRLEIHTTIREASQLERRQTAIASATPKLKPLKKFEAFAGKLWYEAMDRASRSGSKRVGKAELANVLEQLHKSEFSDPRRYMEGKCKTEVATYNQKHPNAAITNWPIFGQKRLRDCKRRLYRAASKYKANLSARTPADTNLDHVKMRANTA